MTTMTAMAADFHVVRHSEAGASLQIADISTGGSGSLVQRAWQPCQYCGFTVVRRRICPCRQLGYCDRLCQARDWQQHKRVCLWRKHRQVMQVLTAATHLPDQVIGVILLAAGIQPGRPRCGRVSVSESASTSDALHSVEAAET